MATLRNSLTLKAALLSLLIFGTIVFIWQVSVQPPAGPGSAGRGPAVDPEYAKLVGAVAATGAK